MPDRRKDRGSGFTVRLVVATVLGFCAVLAIAIVIGLLFAAVFFLGGRAFGHHSAEHDWLASWIPPACCVTNNCCFEVTLADLDPLEGDRWRIKASGQVVARTGWSKDGRYWRCACDATAEGWRVHAKANTRCLFVPMPST